MTEIPCASSKMFNITMVAHLLHLATKWPFHILYESIFSPRQNEVRCVAVTCNAKGEMMEEYLTFYKKRRTT